MSGAQLKCGRSSLNCSIQSPFSIQCSFAPADEVTRCRLLALSIHGGLLMSAFGGKADISELR